MRVLVLDDDVDSRNIVRAALEYRGHEVLEAGTGLEVLHLAKEHSLDVILMDLEVPGMNGWETTHALRSDTRTEHIPVIAVSAHALREHKARATAVGCVGYLTKPLEPLGLASEIETILRSVAQAGLGSELGERVNG